MNSDQFQGKWEQFKGALKAKWGKLTDDDLEQIKGDHQKFVGKLQERYGDKKAEVLKWSEQWHQDSEKIKKVPAGSRSN